MRTFDAIVKEIEDNIESDDFEMIMDECMEEIWLNYNQLDSIEPLLRLREIHPLPDFGAPGSIGDFMESFYKHGYEEQLISSIERTAALHTLLLLNRLINGTENPDIYLCLLKNISEDKSYKQEIREVASHFLSLH